MRNPHFRGQFTYLSDTRLRAQPMNRCDFVENISVARMISEGSRCIGQRVILIPVTSYWIDIPAPEDRLGYTFCE